ncbi:hypothetical protein BJ165DRAFT_1488429 [Panaeolus papilionaceus]|nr:hypothetical protein BJ165DRAFT_1488429 [Panaeolus papilionaceus]
MDSTEESAFPFEIYGKIIDIIDNESVATGLSLSAIRDNTFTLKSCALVCRAFGHLTRPYIFRTANISLYEGKKGDTRLQQFTRLLEEKPSYRDYITDLHLNFVDSELGYVPIYHQVVKLQQCIDIVRLLPNINSLTLLSPPPWCDPQSSDADGTSALFGQLIDFCGIGGPQLRTLHARRLDYLLHAKISGSALVSLTLDRCQWLRLSAPLPHLISLKAKNISAPIRLSFLFYLPNLTELEFELCEFQEETHRRKKKATAPVLRPSFQLTTLSINPSKLFIIEYLKFYGFYCDHQEETGVEPFQNITTLKIGTDSTGITSTSIPDLTCMPTLRHLFVRVDTPSALGRLQLEKQKLSLLSLTLKLTANPWSTYHDETVAALPEIFTSITPDNGLRKLTLEIMVPAECSSYSDQHPNDPFSGSAFWPNLVKFLLNCLNFPMLRTVIIELRYDGTQPRKHPPVIGKATPVVRTDTDTRFYLKSFVGDKKDDGDFMQRICDLHQAFISEASNGGLQGRGILASCTARIDLVRNYDVERCVTIVFGSDASL